MGEMLIAVGRGWLSEAFDIGHCKCSVCVEYSMYGVGTRDDLIHQGCRMCMVQQLPLVSGLILRHLQNPI